MKKDTTTYSPNFDERADARIPSIVLLHYTGMRTACEALERLCDPNTKVSAHYVIDEDGHVRALVAEDKRAWHAGLSFWDGERDINSASIGIEIVNPGHEFGYRVFPQAQINAVVALCTDIKARYDIPTDRFLAHSDVSPARKTDPGELFPWEKLAAKGFGLWPSAQEREEDKQAVSALCADPEVFKSALVKFGYDPDIRPDILTTAFHRHFCPDKILRGASPHVPDEDSAVRLLSLLRQKGVRTA
ncbi:MAG: N-acetylmuramoyl-L-alanine amidase [Alphaproteobacteria bacterium]